MKTRVYIVSLLALTLMVSGCQSDRAKTLHPELFRNGHVTVAGLANNTPESDETMNAIGRVFNQAGIKVGFECLQVCDVRVPEKDRLRALDLLAKNPELQGRSIHIYTDAEIIRLKEPKVPVFSINFKSPMSDHKNIKTVVEVLRGAGIRWRTKNEEGRLAFSVATAQKRSALKLLKNNAALQGIDIQFVE